MSVELVTGYYGVDSGGKPNRHVSSAEDGARQAGTLGLGCYALSTGSKLSATMEDANTLVVADGDVVMNGRHVSLPDPTSFTIPTGVQGQKVSNIAVLRYQKAADSVESVTPLVLTGEPSAGTPTDPTYNEGSILDGDSPVDLPLYRVITDGINAGDPEPLFETIPTIDSLRDSVSHGTETFEVVSHGSSDTTVVKFDHRFASPPSVVAMVAIGIGVAGDAANIACSAYLVTEDSFTLRVSNATSRDLGPVNVSWIAVG